MSSRKQDRDARQNARAARRAAEERKQKQLRLFGIIGAAVAIALVAVVVLVLVNRDDTNKETNVLAVVPASTPAPEISRDGLTIGSATAPVRITEYGDYQCPYCGKFSTSVFPTLLSSYIANGQVAVTFVPFSFLGDESVKAAEAALCANDQGKFWEMHETIYLNQSGENKGGFNGARLRSIAETTGLDMAAFDSCVQKGTHADQVAAFTKQSQADGVTSTPSFRINDGPVFSFSTWDDFQARILAAQGQ